MVEQLKTAKVKSSKARKPRIKTWEEMTPEERERFEKERSKIEANIRRSLHGLPTKEEWVDQHKPKVEVLKVKLSGCSKGRFHKVCKHTYYEIKSRSELLNQPFNPNTLIGMRDSDLVRRPPAVKKVVEYSCSLCNNAIPRCKAEPDKLVLKPDDGNFY